MNSLRVTAALGVMLIPAYANATLQEDAYMAGYADGVLKQNFKQALPPLAVKDGVITLPVNDLEPADRTKAVKFLTEIPGVNSVNTVEASAASTSGNGKASVTESTMTPTGLLPKGHLFKPLLADTRWAHFSAAYRNYQSNNFDGRDIASVSFGETIPVYRSNFGHSSAQWEAGLQAGVFSDFNLGASSSDLLNTDFIASIYSSARVGQFSAFGRIYHQSSHLGDEFLLRKIGTQFERINLSYEGADLKVSYELPFGVRLYGGGGGLFHKEPSELKRWSAQYGVEFRSPWRIDFASMRPIIAADIKHYDQNNWSTDVSARAGVEFENSKVLGRKLQILAEYYNGYTPSGQFYKEKVEYIGLGAHYHF